MATVFIYVTASGEVVRQFPPSVQTTAGITPPSGHSVSRVTRNYQPNEMIGRIRQSNGTVIPKASNFPILTAAQALSKCENFLRAFNANVQEQHWLFEDTFKGTPNKARVDESIKATRVWGWHAGAVLYGVFTGVLFANLTDAEKWAIIDHIYIIFTSPELVRIWYTVMQSDNAKRTAYAGFPISVNSAIYGDYLTTAGAVRSIDGSQFIILGSIPAGYLPQV